MRTKRSCATANLSVRGNTQTTDTSVSTMLRMYQTPHFPHVTNSGYKGARDYTVHRPMPIPFKINGFGRLKPLKDTNRRATKIALDAVLALADDWRLWLKALRKDLAKRLRFCLSINSGGELSGNASRSLPNLLSMSERSVQFLLELLPPPFSPIGSLKNGAIISFIGPSPSLFLRGLCGLSGQPYPCLTEFIKTI